MPLVNAHQSRFASSGMPRTRDGGHTWQSGQAPGSVHPAKLVVDPTNANVVYALAAGVFRSIDGGESWRKRSGLALRDLEIPPLAPAILYGATDTGLFVSADAGATWAQLPFPESRLFAITVDPFHAQTFGWIRGQSRPQAGLHAQH